MSDPFNEDEDDYEPEEWRGDDPVRYHECKRETIGESCGFCGNDLCPMCFECGAGFCSAAHTYEQICAYEDQVYPPANKRERQERERQRQAHRELVARGVIEGP